MGKKSTYLVPRIFIATHGLKAGEIGKYGFKRILDKH